MSIQRIAEKGKGQVESLYHGRILLGPCPFQRASCAAILEFEEPIEGSDTYTEKPVISLDILKKDQ